MAPDSHHSILAVGGTQGRPKLMIVDDQEFLQKVTASIIEKIRMTLLLNFEIVSAMNGEEAVNKYMHSPREYRLIFMDIQMPILNGY